MFFDFMLSMFNHLNQLYEKKKRFLIDTILKYQSMNDIAKEVKNQTDKIIPDTEIGKIHQSLLQKKGCFVDVTNKKIEHEVIPTNKF